MSQELTVLNEQGVSVTAPQPSSIFDGGLLTVEVVEQIEKQVDLVKRMRLSVCKLTEPTHWMDFGGKPYLLSGGIHTIASTIGVEFGRPEVRREDGDDERGKWTRFQVNLRGTWRGREIHEVGGASSRDDLYKNKPLGEILGDLEKKAITNAQHRVLDKITGIGGVTWDLLAKIGISKGGSGGSIRYRGSERKMTTGAGAWTPEKQKLWGYLIEVCGGEDAAAEELFRLTNNPAKGFAGVKDAAMLSQRQVEWIAPRVEAEWKKLFDPTPQTQEPAREAGAEG